ncbi:2-amino-4-hydroxy-6-hydroxymethyldihydropteridine diphosphokinase [Candidatus Paracaedibacter symbiosus]|uniref:2-amino-4-hydroxy-6- hydroxymethyldihydropteridine diphosphokinase n=1 Tax=Candidatus Paracaedibacter symbiosus TaxID=244582 RepID=UPI000509E4D9|nr:2-amino-4-hydroxy-6-hydroxymethyldihydropteridine diphosphokinase [Candidatus Paracaedibacter symbiosus]
MATVYLGLGSNLGDCRRNLACAITELETKVRVVALSSVLCTKPMYVTEQPDFYNQVIEIETTISVLDLLEVTKNIEVKMGRTPTYRYGPRVIDIDMLYYDQLIFKNSILQIPHPHNDEREFILALMSELAPTFICPVTKTTIMEKLTLLKQKTAA